MATVKIDIPNGKAVVVGPYDERKVVRFLVSNQHRHQGSGEGFAELDIYFGSVRVRHLEDRRFDNASLNAEFDFVLEKGATAPLCFVSNNTNAVEVGASCTVLATLWQRSKKKSD